MPRRLGLLLVLAAIGVIAGVEIGAHARSAPRAGALAVRTVRSGPSTCLIDGATCPIHACTEFVASARARCATYPSPQGRTVFVRR
jgi:hypothetical protein